MSERTEERERETGEVGVDLDVGSTTDTDTADAGESGGYVSGRAFLFALAAVAGGTALLSLLPLIPFVEALGIPAGAFVYGLVASERRYVETGVAGTLTGGLLGASALFTQLVTTSVATGNTRAFLLVGVAAVVGLVVSLVGHYFGRDLRDGLTRDL